MRPWIYLHALSLFNCLPRILLCDCYYSKGGLLLDYVITNRDLLQSWPQPIAG